MKLDKSRLIYQKKVIDRESRIIPRKIKKTVHSLKNPNYIGKISYMLPEIGLTNGFDIATIIIKSNSGIFTDALY